ncbi:hypothetical protein PG989_006469 [Apiospora arundinis]
MPSNISSGTSTEPDETAPEEVSHATRKGPRFWAILGVLALASLLTSLEATITSTVLPVIIEDLGGGIDYIWVANAYFLTM